MRNNDPVLPGHSSAGDLTPYLTAYFGTTTGPKAEPSSYTRIAESLRIAAEAVVFVSDSPHELDAARACGMRTRLAVRPGNPQRRRADTNGSCPSTRLHSSLW